MGPGPGWEKAIMAPHVATFPAQRAFRTTLQDGDPGIAQTIRAMRGLALGAKGVGSLLVRKAALQMVRGVPAKDASGEIQRVFDWVKQNIEFRGEYEETLQSPEFTLNAGAGDCDDHSTLIAALLLSLGHPVRFQTVTTSRRSPQFIHVFAEVFNRKSGQWTPLDTTVARSYVGWYPERVTRSQAWQPMAGLGSYVTLSPPAAKKRLGILPWSVRAENWKPGMGRMGQDQTSVTTGTAVTSYPAASPGISPAQIPGLSPLQNAIYATSNQFSTALASRIARGPTPNYNAGFALSGPGFSGNSSYILLGLGILVAVIFIAKR